MYIFVKRVSDILFSLFGLLLLFPLFILVSLFIVIDSKGPIFYRGIRTGLHYSEFKIYKFRSMVHNSESRDSLVTSNDDLRVTKIGKIIRKLKVDELPQLFNVLRGDMSVVGPRPEVPLYTSQYSAEEREILSVKPGITDFSSIFFIQLDQSVGSNKNEVEFQSRIENVLKTKSRLRLKYVYERSFFTDLKIIFITVYAIVKSLL